MGVPMDLIGIPLYNTGFECECGCTIYVLTLRTDIVTGQERVKTLCNQCGKEASPPWKTLPAYILEEKNIGR